MSTNTLLSVPDDQPRAPASLVVEDLGKKYFLASKRVEETARKTLNLGFARVPIPKLSLPGRSNT